MNSPAFVIDTVVVVLLLFLLFFTIAMMFKIRYDLKALSRQFMLNHCALELNIAESFKEAASHFVTRVMPGDLLQNNNLVSGLQTGVQQPSAPQAEDDQKLAGMYSGDHLYDDVDLDDPADFGENFYELPS